MPSTHSRLVYHLVFSTKDRRPLILPEWRARLHEYLGGIVRSLGGVALRVNGTADHVHLVVSLRPTHRVSDVMREIKHESSAWVRTTLRPAMFGKREYELSSALPGRLGHTAACSRGWRPPDLPPATSGAPPGRASHAPQ